MVTKAVPFDHGGSAAIVRNLFQSAKENQVFIVGRKPDINYDLKKEVIPFSYRYLPLSNQPESIIIKAIKFSKSIVASAKYAKQKQVDEILGVYRDETSFVLALFLSFITGLKLNIYLTDLYAENYSSWGKRLLQSIAFSRAKNIFCVTEGMQKFYKERYNLNAILIPHTVNNVEIPSLKTKREVPFTILFSGTIVYDRLDLLQQLVFALKDNADYHIRLMCPHNEAFLIQHNLLESNVSFAFTSDADELMAEINNADLLYLPLTFKKQIKERSRLQLETCLGTKSFDYMQSGVPILVQCPEEYLTYQYFAKRNAAILLNEDNTDTLFELLETIRLNYNDYTHYANAAKKCLQEHDSRKTYNQLMSNIFNE